jgi:hypothetical protein
MSVYDWSNVVRKDWKPSNPLVNSEFSRCPKTISRMLNLIPLEMEVQKFIIEGLNKPDVQKLGDQSDFIINNLFRNSQDEDTHELALTRCKLAIKNYDHSQENIATSIINQWRDLSDNPITCAAALEAGLFFLILPFFNNYGTGSLRITANSISEDEQKHALQHKLVAKMLQARPSKQLLTLLQETVIYISEDMAEETNGKWNVDRSLRNSANLLQKGVSDMVDTKSAIMNAAFEISNANLPSYA